MQRTLVIHLPGLADIHQGLKSRGSWVLGASTECDIPVRARGVSRRHLKLTAEAGGLAFEDLGSTNGTFLNGEPAKRGPFKEGAVIQIGECTLVLADTKTEALMRPAETASLPVITTVELKLPAQARGGEAAWQLPAVKLAEFMEQAARAADSSSAMRGICGLFAESLECGAAKCFRRENSHISLQAVHGDFPDDVISPSLVSACVHLPNPTILDLDGKVEGGLMGLCMPVFLDDVRFVFLGVIPSSEQPLRRRFEALLATPVMLKFLLRWLHEVERNRELVHDLASQVRALKSARDLGPAGAEPILGSSPALMRAVEIADLAAPAEIPVLLMGATGTGKELFARRIHFRSPRGGKPFVAVNCSSIPDTLIESELFGAEKGAFTGSDRKRRGLFEEAAGGTIFLDEIGDLPLAVQPKLLRVLEEKMIYPLGSAKSLPVDVRILSASNRDLRVMAKEGKFRDDLYYRLAGLVVELPPLSLREDDVKILARAFLERANRELGRAVGGFEEEALEELSRHAWPGNVRELLGAVRRLVLTAKGPLITASQVNWALKGERHAREDGSPSAWSLDWPSAKEAFEAEYFSRRLKAKKGSISALAKELGLSRPSLYEKLKKLGINASE